MELTEAQTENWNKAMLSEVKEDIIRFVAVCAWFVLVIVTIAAVTWALT